MLGVKHRPAVRRVNHQARLIQIPSADVCCRLDDVHDLARVSAMSKRNRVTNTSLCAIWICNHATNARSGLTTQAQRPGAREAWIATATLSPGSLQRIDTPIKALVGFAIIRARAGSATSPRYEQY